jgi:ribonuclease HII
VPALSLAELRRRYVERGRPLPHDVEQALLSDARTGARAILDAVNKRRRDNRVEGQRLRNMLRFETELWKRGVTCIAGVDEAGMSPLAGPVAAGAVVLKVGWRAVGLNDSKQVDPKKRAELAETIKEQAEGWAVAYAEPDEIDRVNIYWAGLLAMTRAVQALGVVPAHLLIDARRLKDVAIEQSRIIKGDERSLSIAAASILAKTSRDARMRGYDEQYPGYGFAKHKGYPVREHFAALRKLGPCPIHRASFDPVRRAHAGE